MKFELKVLELTEEEISTIVEGAMQGCAYWCEEVSIRYNNFNIKEECESIDTFSERVAKSLKNNCELIFTDNEDGTRVYLTYDRLIKSVEKFIKEGRCTNIDEMSLLKLRVENF